jgi:conjugative relaxase-like TrwC/TraI family protein
MFTMAKIRDGSTYLGNHLTHSDYYAENERVVGQWEGMAAERLGLAGRDIQAGDEAFEQLRQNRLPDGAGRLTVRDAKNRVKFFDFQVSAQKSVSIMALTGGDSRLIDAHRHAAGKAFVELEKFAACQNNTRAERRIRLTGNVCAARFGHTASRALDPQLHEHFVTVNATYNPVSGQWLALTEREMLNAIRYAGKVYQNELAVECRQLGYELDMVHDARGETTGFEIRGVSAAVRQRFSKRRKEVEAGIAEFERKQGRSPTPAEVNVITKQTRPAKLTEATTEQVLRWQRAELSAVELRQLEAVKAAALARGVPQVEPFGMEQESLRRAISHLFERRSVLSEQQILAEALNQKLGLIRLDKLQVAIHNEPQLVRLGDGNDLTTPCATRLGLAEEKTAIRFVTDGKGRFARLGGRAIVAPGLSDEQQAALDKLLASPDQVVSLRGAAGVGKTTALNELRRRLEGDGKTVLAVAPTTSATDMLRREGFLDASTVAAFLARHGKTPVHTVLFVDEAGLLSNKQGVALLRWAEANQARVIFIGDTRQHSAVEAGDFLRVLENHSPLERAEIGQVRRQQNRDYRAAVQAMATGCVKSGMDKLDALGWIHEGRADYLAQAATEYVRRAQAKVGRVICVCPTWAENHALTSAIRQHLQGEGKLSDGRNFIVHDSLSWTKAQRADFRNYQPGMLLAFNERSGGFTKGSSWTVVATDASGIQVNNHGQAKTLDVKAAAKAFDVGQARALEIAPGDWVLLRNNDRSAGLLNGQVHQVESVNGHMLHLAGGLNLNTQEFNQFAHGYAITSHKAQGLTVNHVIVAAERLDGKAAYVACSRGKWSCSVHTPDKAVLLGNLPTEGRAAALDFLPGGSEGGAGLNRTTAFQSVAKAKLREAGADLSAVLSPWQFQLCRYAVHWVKDWAKNYFSQEQEIV